MNKNKILTVQQKLNIVNLAKKRIKNGNSFYLCTALSDAIHDELDIIVINKNVSKFIDLLSIPNATIACRERHVTLPKMNGDESWWYWYNKKSRLATLNWLIEQYTKQL